MKAVAHTHHIEVFPNQEEVKQLCKIGQGADTCIFLVMSPSGWECHGLNRGPINSIIDRARQGLTNAQRLGCEEVLTYQTDTLGEVEIPTNV